MGKDHFTGSRLFGQAASAGYIDSQYQQWKKDPAAVTTDWRFFFEGFELGFAEAPATAAGCDADQGLRQSRVEELIYRYRDIGHLLACLDPLVACPTEHALLSLAAFDLKPEDLDREFYTRRFSKTGRATLREIIKALKETYCRSIGIEYMHLQDPEECRWLQERMEPVRNRPPLDPAVRLRILKKLCQSALFESFLNKKYIGQTRFSLEGADALIPMLDGLIEHIAGQECQEIILGMAHRGRLNVQANILAKPYEDIFSEFESCYDPDSLLGAGDVKYHNGYLADVKTGNEQQLRIYLVNNPSHLEAVNPVVEGISRARQDLLGPDSRQKVLPLLIHGDAAFAGQGLVAETLNLSQLEGYSTGGTLHVVINNQIGYTTLPEDARSTRYSTDIAKMLMVPVFHVHGEDPEAVHHVMKLAADYRTTFKKDVVVDLICYRRFGHNEGDEPYFTQPQMYDRIKSRPPLNRIYADRLLEDGTVEKAAIAAIEETTNRKLEDALKTVRDSVCLFPQYGYYENWSAFHGNYTHEAVQTGVTRKTLITLARRINTVPEDFSLHPKLRSLLKKRLDSIEKGADIDWANAEALAFATLLSEGLPIRLSGQDSRRGTFSQRHSMWVDTQTGRRYTPLNALDSDQARFEVYNSMLAEASVLGFEYGYSLVQPGGLVLWEAQFGDFVNNAQAVIDLFLASGQSKWQRLSGLVLLLPHGYEGMGPEHSSARLERFLQLCANDNMQVVNATNPAQYFHLLRRQMVRAVRKPLIVMTPKSLLRHPLATSSLDELSSGGFQEVLDDPIQPQKPRRVLFCSGKIFYELFQKRQELESSEISVIRLEQLYPFPKEQLQKVINGYRRAKEWIWVQEEPENMGGWRFVRPLVEAAIGNPLQYIGRESAASPATGFPHIFRQQQAEIIEKALGSIPKAKRRASSG